MFGPWAQPFTVSRLGFAVGVLGSLCQASITRGCCGKCPMLSCRKAQHSPACENDNFSEQNRRTLYAFLCSTRSVEGTWHEGTWIAWVWQFPEIVIISQWSTRGAVAMWSKNENTKPFIAIAFIENFDKLPRSLAALNLAQVLSVIDLEKITPLQAIFEKKAGRFGMWSCK